MSIFGQTSSKPSLFVTPPASNDNGQSPFGQPQPAQEPQKETGKNMFGNFGQSTQQPQQSSSVFGQPQQQQQQSSSVFGQPQQQQTNSLFGQPQQQQQNGASLFGGALQKPSTPNNTTFGNPQQQQTGGSLFGQPQQQQQQQQQSLFGGSQTQQPQHQSRSLWQPGQMPQPREKSIPEQMQTVLEKWSPESNTCLFQHYFYNTVRPETVPYYGPTTGEDEAKWEEALAKKPSEDAIPVLCKGFAALGHRLRIQVQAVNALQARLHEVNGSLTAILQAHDLDITVRTNDAKRKHVVLTQRTLQLATKIQILRSRGYALDGAEEGLRKKLLELERGAFDPRLNGRQEEIWARMVGLRDRARFLQEETERAGKSLADGSGDVFDQEIIKKTRKILGDYDSQIAHLSRELELVRKDFEEYEQGGAEQSSRR